MYTYDWGEGGRTGSWSPGGESTHINCYRIDFVARVQTNLDNQRKRSIRIVWVRPQDVTPQHSGQLPTTQQVAPQDVTPQYTSQVPTTEQSSTEQSTANDAAMVL